MLHIIKSYWEHYRYEIWQPLSWWICSPLKCTAVAIISLAYTYCMQSHNRLSCSWVTISPVTWYSTICSGYKSSNLGLVVFHIGDVRALKNLGLFYPFSCPQIYLKPTFDLILSILQSSSNLYGLSLPISGILSFEASLLSMTSIIQAFVFNNPYTILSPDFAWNVCQYNLWLI